MKDLYQRLGITPDGSTEVIEQALRGQTDKTLIEAARWVLLTPHRKEYDLAHRHLHRIAQLRANLGLRQTDLWRETQVNDFDQTARSPESELAKLKQRPSLKNRLHEPLPTWARPVLCAAIVVGWWWAFSHLPTRDSDAPPPSMFNSNAHEAPSIEAPDIPTMPLRDMEAPTLIQALPQPMPATGIMTRKIPYKGKGPVLRLKTGVATGNVLAKVVDAQTGAEVVRVFIRRSSMASVTVPAGEYRIRYATGETWYGPEALFGPETAYAEADEVLTFTLTETDTGLEYDVGTVELIQQAGGNLDTTVIDASKF